MAKFYIFFIGCLLSIHSAWALEKADEAAINTIVNQYTDAWNDHTGKGFGESFSKDADFVNIFGMHFSGKEEIEFRHIKILESFLKDSKLSILSTKLREVQPGLVIGIVRWKLDGFRQPGSDLNAPGVMREGVFTQVFVQHENQWKIEASQNTLIPR